MSTSNDGSVKLDPECALLEEGAESYVQAVSAIFAFRALVQARCRQVVQKRLKEYSAALGATIDPNQIRDYDAPGESKWGDRWASVGVQIRGFKVGIELFHMMGWTKDEDDGTWGVTTGASAWLQKRAHIELLAGAFAPHPETPNFWQVPNALGYSAEIDPRAVSAFDVQLDEVLSHWIKLWKRVGGLKVLAGEE